MRSSCFESAKNMQFPSPWLSEIAKPFSNAVLCKACHRSVLLDSMRASRRICWSARKMGSPVNGRRKLLKKRMRLFHVSLIGHDELVCTKNSRRYKFAVLSRSKITPFYNKNKFWLWFVWENKQLHHQASILLQHRFQSHSEERHLLVSHQRLKKIERNVELQNKLSHLKKINDPIWEALHLFCVIYYKPKF